MSLRWYAFLCGFGSDVPFTIEHLRSISFFCQNAHHDWLIKEYISNWFLVFDEMGSTLHRALSLWLLSHPVVLGWVASWILYKLERSLEMKSHHRPHCMDFGNIHNIIMILYVNFCALKSEVKPETFNLVFLFIYLLFYLFFTSYLYRPICLFCFVKISFFIIWIFLYSCISCMCTKKSSIYVCLCWLHTQFEKLNILLTLLIWKSSKSSCVGWFSQSLAAKLW